MDQTLQPATTVAARLARLVASFFYVGFAPVVPGTFGSLAAVPLYLFLVLYADWPEYGAVIIIISAIGIWAGGRAENDSKIVDPSFVVIDEVAGQLLTLFLVPVSWPNLLAGFLVFRILDIVKPFPARRAETLHGGWGIMTDDLLAGLYGNILMQFGVYATARYF